MKRFFFALSVALVALMIITAGASAALHYGGIWTETKSPAFLGGWGITQIPFTGKTIIFPSGDLHIIKRARASEVAPGDVVLFAGGSSWFVKAGCVEAVTADTVRLTVSDGTAVDEPASSVFGVYSSRIPRLVWLLGRAQSPVVVGIFTAVLLICIILWRRLPGRGRQDGALSESDCDIASILY